MASFAAPRSAEAPESCAIVAVCGCHFQDVAKTDKLVQKVPWQVAAGREVQVLT